MILCCLKSSPAKLQALLPAGRLFFLFLLPASKDDFLPLSYLVGLSLSRQLCSELADSNFSRLCTVSVLPSLSLSSSAQAVKRKRRRQRRQKRKKILRLAVLLSLSLRQSAAKIPAVSPCFFADLQEAAAAASHGNDKYHHHYHHHYLSSSSSS